MTPSHAAIILALTLTGCATQPTLGTDRVYWSDGIEQPPAAFDHAPGGLLIVDELPMDQVIARCTPVQHARGTYEAGCAWSGKAGCRVTIPRQGDVPDEYRTHLLRHERAHCNGWRHPI